MAYPWAWLMYHALDLGVSAEEFWNMSARAIVLLHKEMRRGVEAARSSRAAAARPQSRRLNYIPRP